MASTLDITPVVKESVENKKTGVLEFTIQNADVSIVNGLRRTLLTNISTSVIDSKQSQFHKRGCCILWQQIANGRGLD